MDINKCRDLLNIFSRLPQRDKRPTFMEICKHPNSRYEEICSRILQFYFDPFAEHGLKNLWLSALWKAAKQSGELPFYNKVECVTEEYAQGKKIDIVIKSEDFVIAIENKITADLYNPLDIYSKYIKDTYPEKKQILIVLSVFPLNDSKSKTWIKTNGYTALLYKNLFAQVYKELGNNIMGCDQKYLTHMLDFMKTIENMNNDSSKREYDFFMQNKEIIEELTSRYDQHKNEILSKQKNNISELLPKIKEKTNSEWWAWQGWDLGISFNDESNRIGIESSYEATMQDVCGKFHIYITTWNVKNWPPYKDVITANFPNYIKIDENCDNRVYFHLPIIEGNDKVQIIEALVSTYQKMKKITNEIK